MRGKLPMIDFEPEVHPELHPLIASTLEEFDVREACSVSVLEGGANNQNFVVRAAADTYVLRIAGQDSERFRVDREVSVRAHETAARAGLAPELVASKLPEGHTLSRFIVGRTLDHGSIRDGGMIERVGTLLARLHATPHQSRKFSPFDDIRLWISIAQAEKRYMPDDFEMLWDYTTRIETLFNDLGESAFTHNDAVLQNFIASDDGDVVLVDWDYAGLGTPYLDLGMVSEYAQFSADEETRLAKAYFVNCEPADVARIRLMRFVHNMRDFAWAMVAAPALAGVTTPRTDLLPGGATDEDVDFYVSYQKQNADGASTKANSPEFDGLIQTARSTTRGTLR